MNKYKCFIWGVLLSLVLIGCRQNNGVGEALYTIQVRDYQRSIVDIHDFTDTIEYMPIISDTPIGPVLDYCLTDSVMVVLDAMQRVYLCSPLSGRVSCIMDKRGYGQGEYVEARAVFADEEKIYLLDFRGQSVLIYDHQFNYINRVKTEFPALDFSVVGKGYLFFNMNATDELKRIVYTDYSGRVLDSFLSPGREMNLLPDGRIFQEDGCGNVFITEPMSETVYQWNGQSLQSVYAVNFGQKPAKASSNEEIISRQSATVMRSIVTEDYVLTAFISDGMMFFNVYEGASNRVMSGLVNTHSELPFFPSSCSGDALLGIYDIPWDSALKKDMEAKYPGSLVDKILVKYCLTAKPY